MPIRYTLRHGTLRFVTTGDVAYEEGRAVLEAGLDAARARADGHRWPVLFDIRSSQENRSSDELRAIAEFVADNADILSGHCAIVAGDALHYGLARMFSAFSEEHGITVEVFRDAESAESWLEAAAASP